MVKVVTINILFGPKNWGERRELLADGLLAEQPDCILVQEVWKAAGNWLAEQWDEDPPETADLPASAKAGFNIA